MRPRIDVLPLGPQSHLAFVDDGSPTKSCRVSCTQDFLDGAGLAHADLDNVVHQVLACLLERETELPSVVHLTSLHCADHTLLQNLQERLAS